MAEDNLSGSPEPVATTPPTQESLVEDISNLLEPPETDQPEEHEEAAAAPKPEDDLGFDAEDVETPDETDTTEEVDGPEGEVKGGRFAPDSAKVQFNGQTISIADLKGHVDKRVRDFQRGFTEKTQALSPSPDLIIDAGDLCPRSRGGPVRSISGAISRLPSLVRRAVPS